MRGKWQLATKLALCGLMATLLQVCSELPLRKTNRIGVKAIKKKASEQRLHFAAVA